MYNDTTPLTTHGRTEHTGAHSISYTYADSGRQATHWVLVSWSVIALGTINKVLMESGRQDRSSSYSLGAHDKECSVYYTQQARDT